MNATSVTNKNDLYSNTEAYYSSYLNTTIVGYESIVNNKDSIPPNLTAAYYDNCCSFSVSSDLDILFDVVLLKKPIPLIGLNGSTFLTHSARFRSLPSINGFDRGYYCPGLQTTLFSLGYFQKCGGSYSTSTTRTNGVDIYTPDGYLLDSPTMTSFNLLPIPSKLLIGTYFDAAPTPPAGRAFPAHVNYEQLLRCDEVEVLIHRLGFPTDESLIVDISSGKIPTYLTGTDVRLNRQLRGPCPHQLAGKARAPPALTSTSAPATKPGDYVSFDLQTVLDPPAGASTHEIFFYDELSGLFGHELCRTKGTLDVMNAISIFIANNFTVHGHKVTEMHGDDERINESLRTPLAKLGIKVSLSLPGEHARAIERGVETIRSRSCSVLSPLPYVLPLKLTPLLHKAVVSLLNNSVNKRSAPLTPLEIVSGKKYSNKTVPLQFGSCHMVTTLPGKRRYDASQLATQLRYIPKVEVGVCVGPCPLTNGFRFITANGFIGPKVVRATLSPEFVPFGWIKKPYVPIIKLPKGATVIETNIPTTGSDLQVPVDSPTIPITDSDLQVPVDSPVIDLIIPSVSTTVLSSSAPSQRLQNIQNNLGSRSIARLRAQQQQSVTSPPIVPAIIPTTEPTSLEPWQQPPRNRRLPQRFANMMVQNTPIRNTFDELSDPDDKDIDKPIATYTASAVVTNKVRSQTIQRKLDNQRKACARDSTFRKTLNNSHLNNRPSSVQPSPPPSVKRIEVNARQAVQKWGFEPVKASEEKELKKIFITYKSMHPINRRDIQSNAIYLRSMALYKKKSDGTVACRIPIDGSKQPEDSYGETSAVTTDLTDRLFLLSLVHKMAFDANVLGQLDIQCGDIPAAFINDNKLSQGTTGDRQFITKLPKDLLDTTLADTMHEVVGAQYGMKQSNHIYDANLHAVMLDAGYTSSELAPRAYSRRNSSSPEKFSIVIFYVDDFEHYSTCPQMKAHFVQHMINRYSSDTKFMDPGLGTTGLEYTRHPNHSITVTVTKYIIKLLVKAGMDNVEPALTPSLPSLFCIDPNSPLLDAPSAAHFRTMNQTLIWCIPVRFDIQKETRWLCTRNKAPTMEDRAKQVQLLRYLKGAPDIGPTYNGKTTDLPGIRIEGASDVGHAVHPHSGASQIAYQLSIGETNAPFQTGCFAEKGVISPDPTSAEYYGLQYVAKKILYWRQLAEWLGCPQTEPSVIRQDNNSAINLTVAPQLTRSSRFINIRHHYIRSLYKAKLIRPVYTNTNSLGAIDMHTKSTSVSKDNQFLYNRSVLFNDRAKAYSCRIII